MHARRAIAVLISMGMMAGCSTAGGTPSSVGQETTSGSVGTTQAAATTPSTAASIDVPDAPEPAVATGDPEHLAATYADRFSAGTDLAANLLGAMAVAGIPVVGADERNLVGPAEDVIGLPWWFVWTATSQPGAWVTLDDLAPGFGFIPPYDQDAATVAAALVADLKMALDSADPAERFVAHLVAESSNRNGGADLTADGVSAAQLRIDLPTAYVLVGAYVRAMMLGEAAAGGQASNAPAVQPVTFARGTSGRAVFAGQTPFSCSDDGVDGWGIYLASKLAAGAEAKEIGEFKGMFRWAIDKAVKKGELPSSASTRAESFFKGAGYAMAAVNVLAFIAAYAGLKADVAINADPLERHKRVSEGDGKSATVFVSLLFDYNTDEQTANGINCLLLLLTTLGSNATIPDEGSAGAGIEVEFSPGKNMSGGFVESGIVMWGPSEVRLKQDTNESGTVQIDVQGRRQKRDFPEDATPVEKEFSIHVAAQLSPTTASSLGQTGLDAFFCAAGVFGGAGFKDSASGCADYAVDTLKALHWDLGEFTFALRDWSSSWLIDETLSGWHASGTVCDLSKPFEFTWTNPQGGGTVTVTPGTDGSASYVFQGQLAGLPVKGSGPVDIGAKANPPTVHLGLGTWKAHTPAGDIPVDIGKEETLTLKPGGDANCP